MAKQKGNGRIGHNNPPNLCQMEGCENEASTGEGLCRTCYSYLWRWMRRKPGEVLQRRKQIAVWENRLDTLMPAPPKRRRPARGRRK